MSHSLASKTEEAMKCRVFIGNLPNESVTKDLLKSMYAQYGSYVDCSIYKNFGFVQFNDETSANNAVSGTNGMALFDRRIDVKIASEGKHDSKKGAVGKHKRPPINPKNVRPLMGYPNNCSQNTGYWPMVSPGHPHGYQQPIPAPYPSAQQTLYPQPQPPASLQASAASKGDASASSRYCDIICTSKQQQSYAEFIQFTLSRLGFVCCIIILSPNYPVDVLLSRASKDNIPVAVSLKDDNESHRSINLHIFSGHPEEHRNMPLDIAEQFIKKRFATNPSSSSDSASNANLKSFSYSTNPSTPNIDLKGQKPVSPNSAKKVHAAEYPGSAAMANSGSYYGGYRHAGSENYHMQHSAYPPSGPLGAQAVYPSPQVGPYAPLNFGKRM